MRGFAAERHSSARLAGWERVGVRGKRIGMDGVSGARWVRCGGIVVPVFPFAAPGQAGFGGRTGVFGHGFAGRVVFLWHCVQSSGLGAECNGEYGRCAGSIAP